MTQGRRILQTNTATQAWTSEHEKPMRMCSSERRKWHRLRCHCPASLLPLTTANLLLSYSKHETRPPTQRVASATLISCSHRPILAGPAILTHPAPALEGAGGPRSGVQCTLGARTHATWGHCDLMGGSRQGGKSRWAAPGKQSGLGGLRARSQLLKEFCLLWGSSCQGGKEKQVHPTLHRQSTSKTDSEPCHQITQKTQYSNVHSRGHPQHTHTHTCTNSFDSPTFTPQTRGY